MKKELVTIARINKYGVTYTNGIGCSKTNFPNVKVGQEWEITTEETSPDFPRCVFPLGCIVETRLVTDVV